MNLRGGVLGNRYTIEREIGRGGMATVWLAQDAQHNRRIAIKTLHPELAGAIGTDRFLREIRLTAELQHPGVVPIIDSGTLDWDGMRIPWYAMPFLDDESLRGRLNREVQLPIDEALRIATAVGKALAAAHQRNIVHRDIKPENVFLSGDHVYVVDFGVAKAIAATDAERLTSTGLAIGTPTYMSPEQALAGPVDARSDQYSLAVMLYEMLAGEPPFAGPNQQATIARRLTERARPMSTVRATVPTAVERATLRALERTPADRFPSVEAFLVALSTTADPVRVRPMSQRSMVALAGAVLLAAAAGMWITTRGPSVDPEVLTLYDRAAAAYDSRTPSGAVEAAKVLGRHWTRLELCAGMEHVGEDVCAGIPTRFPSARCAQRSVIAQGTHGRQSSAFAERSGRRCVDHAWHGHASDRSDQPRSRIALSASLTRPRFHKGSDVASTGNPDSGQWRRGLRARRLATQRQALAFIFAGTRVRGIRSLLARIL